MLDDDEFVQQTDESAVTYNHEQRKIWKYIVRLVADCLAFMTRVFSISDFRIASPLQGLPAAPEYFFEVARAFGRSRHWVRCQSAPNVEALIHALATSLSLKKRTNCPLTDIIEYLEVHPSSLLIIFDDFQMPGSEDEIEKLTDALGKLSQCRSANVCILLTTRDLPLPEGVAWLHFLVEPLSVDAAMAMKSRNWFKLLGCLPFSISIVARQRQLHQAKTKDLGRIDDVVRISLTSHRFVNTPDALTLLSILARLPKGVQYDNLPRIAPLIQNVFDVLRTILESGHANREADGFILVQAPTRSYLLRYHSLDTRHTQALREYYFQLCEDAGHELGTETFKKASKVLASEEENTQAVLLDALKNEPSAAALKAVIGYTNFLVHDVPNIDVIESNPSLDIDGTLLPHCWFSHGRVLYRLDKYSEAEEALRKAENVWKQTNESALLGQCHYFYGQIHRLQGRQAQSFDSYTKAREYFEMVDNHSGISDCLQGMAVLSLKAGDLQEALRLLDHAKEVCGGHEPDTINVSFSIAWVLRFKDPSHSASLLLAAREAYAEYGARNRAASCTYQLGITQYSSGRNDEAEKSLLLAYRQFDDLVNHAYMGYVLDHLVEVELRRRRYDQALQYNGEALALFEEIGNHAEVAVCYICRGRVLTKMRQTRNALAAYDSAKVVVTQQCNSDPKKMRMIDEDTRSLIGIFGWRMLIPW
ncbi:hypothetical protein F5887DRAFT_1005135 [Amanita rubescens]|nr:hypothetical protein F5887DRAFT_1005135 [Amanita rubescens]